MRLGVLGGSFNPPHLGHLLVAQMALEQLGLDRVLLVPAARPPHKAAADLAPGRRRLAMTRAAARGIDALEVCDIEFGRPGPSYTVDTLEALARRRPRARLTLLIGRDTLADLPGWREPGRVRELARVAVYPRPGSRARASWATPIDGPALVISAREIRARVRRGLSIRGWVPAPVEKYIVSTGLYR